MCCEHARFVVSLHRVIRYFYEQYRHHHEFHHNILPMQINFQSFTPGQKDAIVSVRHDKRMYVDQ